MAASHWASVVGVLFIAILLITAAAAGQQQAPVAAGPQPVVKIPIPNLPPSHYQFWLKNSPSALKNFENICSETSIQDIKDLKAFHELHSNLTFEDSRISNDLSHAKKFLANICSKISVVRKSCWGYEANCEIIYLMPECNHPSISDARDVQEKKIDWFSQADFGYILDRRRELAKYCAPDKHSNYSLKSSLECTKYFRTCRGENLYINLRAGNELKKGDVGGWNCDFQPKRIPEESAYRGFLRSWFDQLESYDLLRSVQPEKACEKQIDKQTYLIQVVQQANMYDYFCSFLNLYATMHLNNRFSEDNQLILWEDQPSNPQFDVMWSVFSRNKPIGLNELKGKQVCLKKFIFSMPPRMVQGLYYRTNLVDGCSKSGLFDAFNKHVLHKLGVTTDDRSKTIDDQKVHVTIVSGSTPTRRILNEEDLRQAADSISDKIQTKIVDFTNITFIEQLRLIHNTDILVGVHGDELTHTLFLPDWAALFELHDPKDDSYRDLARLRGVGYFTLTDQRALGEKSGNFNVNVGEFIKTLETVTKDVEKKKVASLILESTIDPQPNTDTVSAEAGSGHKPEVIVDSTPDAQPKTIEQAATQAEPKVESTTQPEPMPLEPERKPQDEVQPKVEVVEPQKTTVNEQINLPDTKSVGSQTNLDSPAGQELKSVERQLADEPTLQPVTEPVKERVNFLNRQSAQPEAKPTEQQAALDSESAKPVDTRPLEQENILSKEPAAQQIQEQVDQQTKSNIDLPSHPGSVVVEQDARPSILPAIKPAIVEPIKPRVPLDIKLGPESEVKLTIQQPGPQDKPAIQSDPQPVVTNTIADRGQAKEPKENQPRIKPQRKRTIFRQHLEL